MTGRMNADAVLPPTIAAALRIVGERLAACDANWLVGGSCGLLLQGVAVAKQPRDIDLYVNRDRVAELHAELRLYATEEPHYSETPIYRSTLSHYAIAGHTVELVGGFEVETAGCLYAVDTGLLRPYSAVLELQSVRIPLMPLVHELLFNVLRGRPDRFEAVAETIRSAPGEHQPALRALLNRGRWSASMVAQVNRWLGGEAP